MKFEYNDPKEPVCVAYDDGRGFLVIRSGDDDRPSVFKKGEGACSCHTFRFDESRALRKFYPGDKITITF